MCGLVLVAVAMILAAGGCQESDNDKPRFTETAWIEFQDRDNSFVARADRMSQDFEACVRKAKARDQIHTCGLWLGEHSNGLADDYFYGFHSTGQGHLYDDITTDSPCWVALQTLYEIQQNLTRTLHDLGSTVYISPPLEGAGRLASTANRQAKGLDSKRDLARRACSPEP